jgi:hypothetical protein
MPPGPMRLTVSDPAAIPALVAALRAGECLAEKAAENAVDVLFPWLAGTSDARQALVELAFFTRTWEAMHPGVQIRLESAAA